MTITTNPAPATERNPMSTTTATRWDDDLVRLPVPGGSPADTPESLVTRQGQAILKVLERTARLLDPRAHTRKHKPGTLAPTKAFSEGTSTVQILPEGTLNVPGDAAWGRKPAAPAWTDGETIHVRWGDAVSWAMVRSHVEAHGSFEGWSPRSAWDVLKLQGLIWHELSHVIWTPRKDTPLVRHVTADGIFPAFNVLEDMRIEGLFIQAYADARPALVHLALEYLNTANAPTSYMLTAGRPWVPASVRTAQRRAFAAMVLRHAAENGPARLQSWTDTTLTGDALARETVGQLESLVRDYVTIDPSHLRDGKAVEAAKITQRSASNRPTGRLTVLTRPIHEMIQRYADLQRLLGTPGGEGGHVEDGEPNRGVYGNPGPAGGDAPGQDKGEDTEVEQDKVESWDLPEDDPLGSGGDDGADQEDGEATEADTDEATDAGRGQPGGEGDEAGDDESADGESGDGGGEGEGEDADGDEGEDAGGYTKGGDAAPTGADPQDLLDEALDALDEALTDVADDLQAETAEWQSDVLDAAKSFLNGREPLAPMTDVPLVPVSTEIQGLAQRIAAELEQVRNAASAEIIRHTDQGTIDPYDFEIESRRPVPDYDRVWTAYSPGREDEISVEVVIALDCSSSMNRFIRRANEATWAIKRAVEQAAPENVVTTWTFNDQSAILSSAGQPAESGRMPAVAASGGTDPFGALGEAYRLLATSPAGIKLLVMITDGEWGFNEAWTRRYPSYASSGHVRTAADYPEDVIFQMIRNLPGTGTLLVNLDSPVASAIKAQRDDDKDDSPWTSSMHDATWGVEIRPEEITVLPKVFGKLIGDIQAQILESPTGITGPLGSRTTTKLVPTFLDRADKFGRVPNLPGSLDSTR